MTSVAVVLRGLAVGDTDAVHSWARLPEVCRYQGWGPNTYEETAAFVREAVAAPAGRQVFAVVVDGEVVGVAELARRGKTSGEISYVVHPRWWGRGVGTAAARELLRVGFGELGLHRIFATCDPRNAASGAVLRKVGMRYEGRMRGTMRIRDGWRDSDLYAVLADDE